MGEPNVSSDQPRPSGQPESIDRPGPSKQPGASASSSGFSHEAHPAGPVEADEGNMSLFDFSATEICSHLVNNDIYIGDSWGHVKDKSCNRKMEFFFNCHSLMMSELGDNYKYGIRASRELAQLRESSDGHLSAGLAAEEKLSAAEEEIRSLKELMSTSQESFAARLEAERVAEKLRKRLSMRRSPAYDVLLLRKFEKCMRQAKKFFAMKGHSNEKALRRFDRTEPHPMHLEIPSKRAFNTYYSGQKGSFSGSGAEPDLGPVAGRDYEPFMPMEDEEIIWPSDEEIEDKEDSEGPPAAG
ncbi:hypothetical protein LWI29_027180 [Acer saccharum]|uniref:Uncharacterized protein n=1 Tax=Acer saccharum TaxID=4024 RepID=A0AA39S364_ACESA|nr:hypothetical protein LWI29_027180 [Acer saccharum]